MYQVIDWEKDMAGKWRVRIDIKGSTIMFKYDEMPDDEVLQLAAANYEAMMQEQADGAPDPV